MKEIRSLITALMSLTLLLSACSGQHDNHGPMDMPVETPEIAFEPGAWREMTLTDARTRDEFRLSDYGGQVVILEMMDPGCPICEDQLRQIAEALEVVGTYAFAVSVDIGYKGEAALVNWAETNNATWPVAFISKEFSQALVSEFGPAVVYPGNTPVIIIDPTGTAHVTDPGIKKAAALVQLVNRWKE